MDLAPYIEVLRKAARDLVDDDELREVIDAAVAANREAREHHDQHLQRIQDKVNRRAAAYGDAWDQVMREAARLDDT